MKNYFKYIKIPLLALVLLLAGSCNDYLDINDDPNNPTAVPLSQILPFAQATTAGALGLGTAGLSDILEVWTHHLVQRSNHDDYATDGDDFNLTTPWDKIYAVVLTDLREVIRIGAEQENWHYVGIAQVLRVYAYSALVDIWGDVPYSEAVQGAANPFPPYDDGKAIYTDLFFQLDEGIKNLNRSSKLSPMGDDLIYGGNIAKWIRFANTLKLNMYNRVRMTDLYEAAEVDALLKGGSLMASIADDFELVYGKSLAPENRHPGFVREYAQQNPQWYISPYFYQLMQGNTACQNPIFHNIADPRIPYYFYNQLAPGEPAENPPAYQDDQFLSIWFGSLNRDPNEGFDQSSSQTIIGLYPAGGQYDDGSGVNANANMGLAGASAQRLLTYTDLQFVRTELALTENTGEDARDLFLASMQTAFTKVNQAAASVGAPLISETDRDAYIDAVLALYDAGDDEKKLELVMTQKWIAAFGAGLESYNDIRRTGYPLVYLPNNDPNPFTAQTRSYPLSLPYNTNDLQINPNAPEQRNKASDKVFWDVD